MGPPPEESNDIERVRNPLRPIPQCLGGHFSLFTSLKRAITVRSPRKWPPHTCLHLAVTSSRSTHLDPLLQFQEREKITNLCPGSATRAATTTVAAAAVAEFPRAFRFSRVHVIIIFHSSIPLPLGDIVLRACVGFTWVNAAQVSVINCHRAGSRGAVINFERMMESLSFSSSRTSSLLAPIYGRVSLSSDAAVGERLSEE